MSFMSGRYGGGGAARSAKGGNVDTVTRDNERRRRSRGARPGRPRRAEAPELAPEPPASACGLCDVSNEIAEAAQQAADAASSESAALREENELLRARIEELEAAGPDGRARLAAGAKRPAVVCSQCLKRRKIVKGTSPPACARCVARAVCVLLIGGGAIGLLLSSC